MMYTVGAYGTLMSGFGLNHAMEGSTFLGRMRLRNFRTIMVLTSAGYPAAVNLPTAYIEYLSRKSKDWWEQYVQDSGVIDPIFRTGWHNGIDMPLVELYKVHSETLDALDAIEGVPALYTRHNQDLALVTEDRVYEVETGTEWRELVLKDSKDIPKSMRPKATDLKYLSLEGFVYMMNPEADMLQGQPIIWNGDFRNQLLNPVVTFDYVAWKAERARPRRGDRFVVVGEIPPEDLV